MAYPNLEDMYAAIGYGGFTAQKAVSRMQGEINRVLRQRQQEQQALETAAAKPREEAPHPAEPKKVKSEQGIIVEGLDNCLVKFSKCCTPVPGDEIVGFITRGYGVSVHRADCPNATLAKRTAPGQEGRWIKVSWGSDTNDSYPTTLDVICKDRANLLLDISAALSTTNTFVLGINTRSTEDGFAICRLEVRIRDGVQLQAVMNKLNRISGVLKVTRPAGCSYQEGAGPLLRLSPQPAAPRSFHPHTCELQRIFWLIKKKENAYARCCYPCSPRLRHH